MQKSYTTALSMYQKAIDYSWPNADYALYQKAMLAAEKAAMAAELAPVLWPWFSRVPPTLVEVVPPHPQLIRVGSRRRDKNGKGPSIYFCGHW